MQCECVRAPPDLNSIPRCLTDKILNDDDDLHRSNEQQARAAGRLAGWLAGVTTAEHALLLPSFLPCSFRKASLPVHGPLSRGQQALQTVPRNGAFRHRRVTQPIPEDDGRAVQVQRSRYDDKMVTPRRKEEGARCSVLTHQIDEKDLDGGAGAALTPPANQPLLPPPVRPSISPPRNRLHHRHQLRCRDHQGRHAKITALKDGNGGGIAAALTSVIAEIDLQSV